MLCVDGGHALGCPHYAGPPEPGRRPEVWWCRIVGHRWAGWLDNGGRQPCTRCWYRRVAVARLTLGGHTEWVDYGETAAETVVKHLPGLCAKCRRERGQ